MSIGVLSGTTKENELIEVVFESYYQASATENNNLFGNWLSSKFGISSLNNVSQSKDTFKVLTFDGLQRDGSGRWATHEIIGQDRKPLLEFLGPDLENLSFSVFMSSFLGINASTELQKLRNLRDGGVICDFVIGGASFITNKWVIKSLSEAHKTYDKSGNLLIAVVNISLIEYVKLPEEG
ncbi:phage tail protein [Pelosinus sp. UFO1]|uniref:phage tail protein n=1 Tax=Pelosinus sp. UFO1 TaxID=484770 RepID=UPI0004D13302|nr:phage tail protein [Pelosinus sp. UFO1]AIF51263.1 P2 GpU family protein [Pelosinus sp. UFO1]